MPAPTNNSAEYESTMALTAKISQFASDTNSAAERLFGRNERTNKIREITSRLVADVEQIQNRRSKSIAPAIVLVGPIGAGKSWLARCFLKSDDVDSLEVREQFRTGQNESDRTDRITWIGEEKNFDMGHDETFLTVRASQMIDLGRPYVVGDSPGFSDFESSRVDSSSKAVRSAAIKILVFSASNLRDNRLARFIADNDGAIFLPVVKFAPKSMNDSEPTAEARDDVDEAIGKWRAGASQTRLLDPVFMPQESIFGSCEAINLTQQRLTTALQPIIADLQRIKLTSGREIRIRWERSKSEISNSLAETKEKVNGPLKRVQEATNSISDRLVSEILGDEFCLRAGLRRKFRANLIEQTPQVCFPYRSFLGVLALTTGAWDRLLLSLTGSIPSAVMTAFQAVKNVSAQEQNVKDLTKRIEGVILDHSANDIRNFDSAVNIIASAGDAKTFSTRTSIEVSGLESIEIEATSIARTAVEQNRMRQGLVITLAITGTLLFLYLISGPFYSIYREYLAVHLEALSHNASYLDFPSPPWNMLLSSFVISAVPVFVLALSVMAWANNGWRVKRAGQFVRNRLKKTITRHQEDGRLNIKFADPRLDAAKFLFSIDRSEE